MNNFAKLVALTIGSSLVLSGCSAEEAVLTPSSQPTQIIESPQEDASPVEELDLDDLLESYPFDWAYSVVEMGQLIDSAPGNEFPLDFAASPNTSSAHAQIVEAGVRKAINLWGGFFTSDIPLAVTVVNPMDKDWYFERWESLGSDNTGEFWWNLATGRGGGAAIGWNDEDMIPRMYFMVSDSYSPPSLSGDFYVHEATHFFQVLSFGDLGNPPGGCWIGEGTAEFVGLTTKYSGATDSYLEDLRRNLSDYKTQRTLKAAALRGHYSEEMDSLAMAVARDVLTMPRSDDRCQFNSPMLGYNLGMFVTEKYVLDFGLSSLVDFFIALKGEPIPEAFEEVTELPFEDWVNISLAPYLEDEITNS